MKQYIKVFFLLVFFLLLWTVNGWSQSTISSWRCDSAVGMCAVQSYSFSAAVNGGSAPSGPDYGCLTSQPNATWFFMQIQDTGAMTVQIKSAPQRDLDYVLWGPFTTPLYQCDTGLTASKILSCSVVRNNAHNNFTLNNTSTGLYYILLISNYSNNNTTISFDVVSGSGTANCDVQCNLYGINATASACGSGAQTGGHTVSGTISTYLFPTSGTLTVSSSCGGSVSYNAPFSTTMNYALPLVAGKGQLCTITAVFSAIPSCSRSLQITAPTCCDVTPVSTHTVCEGQTLQLTSSSTNGGTYYWSGPSSFSSSSASPTISNIALTQAGTYQVYVVNGICTTDSKNVSVIVNAKPPVKSILHE